MRRTLSLQWTSRRRPLGCISMWLIWTSCRHSQPGVRDNTIHADTEVTQQTWVHPPAQNTPMDTSTHKHTHTHASRHVHTHPHKHTKSNPNTGLQKSEHFRHVCIKLKKEEENNSNSKSLAFNSGSCKEWYKVQSRTNAAQKTIQHFEQTPTDTGNQKQRKKNTSLPTPHHRGKNNTNTKK